VRRPLAIQILGSDDDGGLAPQISALLGELSSRAVELRAEELSAILSHPATPLFVARELPGSIEARAAKDSARTAVAGSAEPGGDAGGARGSAIVGMCTLAIFPIPSGTRAWIEDVVVLAQARGQGIGRALVQAALDEARRLGAGTVDLTSRPSREAANRLYRDMGFVARETDVYRWSFER